MREIGRFVSVAAFSLVASLACIPSKPIPTIPQLTAWQGNSLTICCNRTTSDLDCSAENWTQVIQTHCTGAAKIASSPPPSVAGESVSQCVTYSCAGTVRPYFS
ncbi:MAG: hypothetical protein V1495_10790, partial [Pseudomonadota bacterium]